MKMKLVSVLMPVYNGELYIREAINSILNQTYTNFELIIVNDASDDKTGEIIKTLHDPRIRVFQNNQRLGLAANRNKSLSLATGDYIAILDADDISYKYRLELQVQFLNEHAKYSVCGSWAVVIDGTGKKVAQWHFPQDAKSIAARFYIQFPLVHSSVMYRKSVVQKASLTYDAKFAPAEDYDFCFKLMKKHFAYILPRNLVKYRLHNTNSSLNIKKTVENLIPKIYKREYEAIGLYFTTNELKNIAVFVNPQLTNSVPLLSTYINLLKLFSKLTKKYDLKLTHKLEWLVYMHKALVLQCMHRIFT